MTDTMVTKIKGFLLNPVETFRQSANDELQAVFTYFGLLLLLNAILSACIAALGMEVMKAYAGMPAGMLFPVMVFFMMLVGGLICTLVFSAWLHLWVCVLGGSRGIMQTVKGVIYASTPRLLLGWIPFLGIVFSLWSLVLAIIGIRELQDLSTKRAVLAVAIAIIIPLILIILVAAYFMVSYMSVMPAPATPANFFR